jgi:autotransporter-associated beta strand protein
MKSSVLCGVWGIVVGVFCVSAVGAETLYPVYTVTSTTGGGVATNYLESSMVQIVDAEDATPRAVAYADIDKSAGNFSGTFVFDADSYLMGSATMINFTGEIYIRSGVLIVDAAGWLGVTNRTDAPKLYVESGATLMPTCPVVRGGKIYNELHLAGDGYNGLGALCCNYRAVHNDYCFYNPIYLEADATIGMESTQRVDTYGSNANIYLQDHHLTIKDVRVPRTSSLPVFCTGSSRIMPGTGHVVVDHINLHVQSSNSSGWGGDKSNILTMRNGSQLGNYGTKVPIRWTLVVEEGDNLTFADGCNGTATFYRSFPLTNVNYYSGPVQLDGKLTVTRSWPYTFTRGVSLYGNVSGKGSIDSPNGWLQLMGSNTYEGVTCARNADAAYGGLALWHEESASTHSAGYFLTNAPLKLVAEGRHVGGEKIYDLPPVNFHVDSFTNFEIGANVWESNIVDVAASGGMNARMASLKKTGAGELALVANFDITGRTEIAGGTLRLAPASRYSAAPGLWEGIFETNETAQTEIVAKVISGEMKTSEIPTYKIYHETTSTLSNRVTSYAYLFARRGSPYWHHIMAPTYSGYIWNRESTNITVTFAGAIVDAWKIYLRGTNVANLYNGAEMATKSVTLHSGANAIMLRGWNRNQTGGWFTPNNKPNWNLPYMGFAMAYGNISTNYYASSYFVPMNGAAACAGGDGFVFTRDPRAPEEFTAEELATTRTTIADLALSGGAILDLSGSPLFIKTLEGAGTVTNGSLTVKEGWTLGYADVASAGGLAVDGTLTFGNGATVVFDDGGARPPHGSEPVAVPLATAKDGVTGTPAFSCGAKNWKMGLSGDGKSLLAMFYPKGIAISFK